MRKLVILCLVIAVIGGMFLLTGCDSQDPDLVGVWEFELDSSFVTTFNADGSGTHAISWGFGDSFRWSTSDNNIYWNYSGHPRLYTRYSISGDVLLITVEDGTVYRYLRVS